MKSNVKTRMFRAAAVLLCGAGLAVSAAVAQQETAPAASQQQASQPGGHRWSPERRAERMQRRLDLTADQTTQMRTILVNGRAKMRALRADASIAQQNRVAQFHALHQEQQAKIRALLTPDQQTKFDRMLAKRREHRRDERNGAASQAA